MRIVEILSAGLIFFVVIVDRVQSVALWKNDFIEQLSAMHDEIDGIFCTNKPSYPPDNCKQTGSFVQCKLKNLNEASRKNMIEELWKVSKGIIRLLETVDVRTTEEIFQRGDILGYSGTLGHSEREIFENLLQTYDMAVTLSDSWDGKYSWHFDQLLVREMDFTMTVSGMAGLDFLRNFYDKNFGWCKALNLLKENQKKNCQSCTEESLNDRLNDIFAYLTVAEIKTFISEIIIDAIRSTQSKSIVQSPEKYLKFVNQIMKSKNNSLGRTMDYLDQVDDLILTSPACEPISWVTHFRFNETMNPDSISAAALASDAGSLDFAVKIRQGVDKKVRLYLTDSLRNDTKHCITILIYEPDIVMYDATHLKNMERKKYSVNLLDSEVYHGYWIEWAEGKVSLGRAGESKPLIDITDVNTTVLSHFVISNANWILYDLPEQPGDGTNRETCWTAEIDRVGNEDGTVCRINHMGTWIPGTVSDNRCYVVYHSHVAPLTEDYQILIDNYWSPISSNAIPQNGVVGGVDKSGEPLYVCHSSQGMQGRVVFEKQCIFN